MTRRNLVVVLVEAKALPLLRDDERSERLPSAYCQVSYRSQKFCSNVDANTVHPHWNQQFLVTLDHSESTLSSEEETILFRVYSKGVGADDNSVVLLGQARVRLDSLDASQSTTSVIPLNNVAHDNNDTATSELVVQFRYLLSSLSSSTHDHLQRTVTWMDLVQAAPTSSRKVPAPPPPPPSSTTEPNHLVVTVLEAQGLLSREDSGGGNIPINPIVKLCLSTEDQNAAPNASTVYQQTRVVPKTLYPQWRQRFFFPFDNDKKSSSSRLTVLVQDQGWLVNKFLGSCVIDVETWRGSFGDRKKALWLALASKDQAQQTADLSANRHLSLGWGCICIAIERKYLDTSTGQSLEQGERDDETIVPAIMMRRASSMALDHERSLVDDTVSGGATASPPSPPVSARSRQSLSIDMPTAVGPQGDYGDAQAGQQAFLTKEEEQTRSLRQAQAEALQQLGQVQFASGDYQIQVHIIQVRELQPMDLNGLCDPVVQVECLGRKQFTRIQRNRLTAFFDEFLYFAVPQVSSQVIQRAALQVTVLDADDARLASTMHLISPSRFSDIIGSVSIDTAFVYLQKNHEIKNQWVALGDVDGKLTGFLQLSVVVLGPNDTLSMSHLPSYLTESEDLTPSDTFARVGSAPSADQLLLLPPQLTRQLHFLVIGIYMLCELPYMHDAAILPHMERLSGRFGAIGGCKDAFVQVDFMNGQQTLQTRVFKVKDHKQRDINSANPVAIVNQELWFPIWLPSMSNSIGISVRDADFTVTQPIANCAIDSFEQVHKQPERFAPPHWANLYGPPIRSSLFSSEEQLYMLQNPSQASTYRGRMLLSLRVEDAVKSVNQHAHVRNLHSPEHLMLPENIENDGDTHLRRYLLRAQVYYGTELVQPTTTGTSGFHWLNRSSPPPLRVGISIGRHSVLSQPAEMSRDGTGICHWDETIQLDQLIFPKDLSQVPDIFVYLTNASLQDSSNMSFTRLQASQLFEADMTPRWRQLQRDFALQQVQDSEPSANVLLSLTLTPQPLADRTPVVESPNKMVPVVAVGYFTLLVHVFQGKSLAPLDDDGLLDPFLKIHCAGVTALTTKRARTRDPCFYETVVLPLELSLSQDSSLPLPRVLIQVFDYDRWGSDDFVGCITKSMNDIPRYESAEEYLNQCNSDGDRFAMPKWYPVQWNDRIDAVGDGAACTGAGELLLSFELVQKSHKEESITPPASIQPHQELKYVEILCLGVRDLQPMGFTGLQAPFVEFDLGASHAAAPTFSMLSSNANGTNGSKITAASSTPSPSNANFLQRLVLPVRIPANPLYAPRLSITVYDKMLGGFFKPLLGVASVELHSTSKATDRWKNRGGRDANPHVERRIDYSTCPIATLRNQKKAFSSSLSSQTSLPMDDQGMGVTAAMNRRRQDLSLPIDASSGDPGDDELPAYLHDRCVLSTSLEATLVDGGSPFQTYTLFRGEVLMRRTKTMHVWDQTNRVDQLVRAVGSFKGLIRVVDAVDIPSPIDLANFFTPQPFLIRVYVLDAEQLVAKDLETNKCNPYLRLVLGTSKRGKSVVSLATPTSNSNSKNPSESYCFDALSSVQVMDDRANHKTQTLFPKFHKMFEFKTQLPGVSNLRIEVRNYDAFSLSAINWFSGGQVDELIGATTIDLEDRWFSSEWQSLGVPSSHRDTALDHEEPKRNPLELRSLYVPSSTIPQGNLRLWVDILTPSQMHKWPAWQISLPPAETFEVRVVIYRSRYVIPGDRFTKLSDLYVKCWFQNDEPHAQCTDIHWRSVNGQACFNWRMKFDVTLPIDPQEEQAKGFLQLQLWDRDVTFDDCVSEAVLDLTRFLNQAHKRHAPVNVFAKKRTHKRESGARLSTMENVPEASNTGTPTEVAVAAAAISPAIAPEEIPDARPVDDPSFASFPTTSGSSQHKILAKHLQAKADAASLMRSIKERLGMMQDVEDASWLVCTTSDVRTGARVHAGELLLSIEILPKQLAELRAAGFGRSEPNCFPFLPEPDGRLNLAAMWNPCYVVEAFVGPELYRSLTWCLLCVVLTSLCILAAPLVNIALLLLNMLPDPACWIVFSLSLATICFAITYCSTRLRHSLAITIPESAVWDAV